MADLLVADPQWGMIQDGWQVDLLDGTFRIRQGQPH